MVSAFDRHVHTFYPTARQTLFDDVCREVDAARQKFPNPAGLSAALMEEAGEFQREANDCLQHAILGTLKASKAPGLLARTRNELVQTIAMCIRVLEEGDPLMGVPPNLITTTAPELGVKSGRAGLADALGLYV